MIDHNNVYQIQKNVGAVGKRDFLHEKTLRFLP